MRLANIDKRVLWLIGISLASFVAIFFVSPIPQDQSYHQFADQRAIAGLDNFFNVVSNLPFVVIGLAGIRIIIRVDRSTIVSEIYPAYLLFFGGVALVGFGSMYYHLDPNNRTLVWDRLPMTLAFMSFFSVIVGEFISGKAASKFQYFLPILGMSSIVYWHYTELQDKGDLRMYGLVQFLPLLLLPMILLMYKPRFSHAWAYWLFFGLYALAKVFEVFDAAFYHGSYVISGHTVKHLLAALGCYVFLRQIQIRRRLC